MAKRDDCSLCGGPLKNCRHPWNKPFDEWPAHLKQELLAAIAHYGRGQ